MSQINPDINGKPDINSTHYTRKLYVCGGLGYKEIANAKGKGVNNTSIGRIINDYSPPVPDIKNNVIKIIDAPPRIQLDGKSGYTVGIRIIFPDKYTYKDFMFYCQNEFKYYSEDGSIYVGALNSKPNVEMVESGRRYLVNFDLIIIRKEETTDNYEVQFTDLYDPNNSIQDLHKIVIVPSEEIAKHYAFSLNGNFTITFNDYSAPDNEFSIDFVNDDSTSIFYAMRDLIVNRTSVSIHEDYEIRVINFKTVEIVNKVDKHPGEASISISHNLTVTNTDDEVVPYVLDMGDLPNNGNETYGGYITGYHWSYEYVSNMGQLGLITQIDKNGNYVYTFRPEAFCTRSEFAAFLNRTINYLERMIR